MIKNINDFVFLKKLEYKNNFEKNKKKKEKKIKNLINEFNKIDNVYNFGIDKTYQLENLHKKINWYKYYLQLYFTELLQKHENIKNNKIDLK